MAARKTEEENTFPTEETTETKVPNPDLEKLLAEQQEQIRQLTEQNRMLTEQQASRRPAGGGMQDADIVKAAAEKAAAEGTDPWTVTVSVRAPRRSGKEDPWFWINVNGLSVQVPADDRIHEMKLPHAETLMNILSAEHAAEKFADSIEQFDPVTNPHKD